MNKDTAFPLSGPYSQTECKGLTKMEWLVGQCLASGRSLEDAIFTAGRFLNDQEVEKKLVKVEREALQNLKTKWDNLMRSRAVMPVSVDERRLVAIMEDAINALTKSL